jgi:hypothetical protein
MIEGTDAPSALCIQKLINSLPLKRVVTERYELNTRGFNLLGGSTVYPRSSRRILSVRDH